ncbi:chorismate mutase [Niallia sp. FSL W8-0635]|uniref:chorismate mutase n=1 Tax=Niallia sp. FSL W8-0635 TaxID=2975337 RepID=UPI0009CEA75A|nr:Chorismate mutase AroH [Mycobacteroides abscessus subsp. abscessus]HEO8422596.1 chorismate mutase [Yersinia enterocolitica]
MIRGVRGAITVENNAEIEILTATETLVREMINSNNIKANDVASVFLSVTDDINAAFPAKVIRMQEDWTYVPVMCMKEIAVPHSLEKCIRIMMHWNTELSQDEIQHIYLEKAIQLRPDLTKQ